MFAGNKLGAMLLVKAVGTLFVTRTCFVKDNIPERKRQSKRPCLPFWIVKQAGRGYGGRGRADRQNLTLPEPGVTPESLAGRRSLNQTPHGQS